MTTAAGIIHRAGWPLAVRRALAQAVIDLRIQLFSPMALGWFLFPGIGLLVLYLLRDSTVLDSSISLAQLGIPGLLCLNLLSGGVLGVAGQVLGEREDGTLLRARSVPHAMRAHVLAYVIVFTAVSLVTVLAFLAGAGLVLDGVTPGDAAGWLRLAWVALLGLTATLPWGAVLGAVMRTPMMLGITTLLVYATLAISGVFYPLSAMPEWLQTVGRCLPSYWMGLGLRSALLPPEAVALEAGASWHTATTAVVLVGWTVAGLALAPVLLRRMARRQSGSVIEAARDRLVARGY